ncbi:hypothetical protein [Tardiphaga sp. 813_E8_N1_3]|uniref:hypothetical protein n=1 Tax=Tardiphaga sp. 813_E8_N1_3 TaxID=3240760 RepID=UPI003F2053B4
MRVDIDPASASGDGAHGCDRAMRGWTAAKIADASGACGALPNIVAPPSQHLSGLWATNIYINWILQQKFIYFYEFGKSV